MHRWHLWVRDVGHYSLHASLKLAVERKSFEKWRFFHPVPKQEEFLTATATFNEVLLMAGNGNGKTETAAYAVSRWMTGEYPPWWTGLRFDRPVRVWLGGTSSKASFRLSGERNRRKRPPGNSHFPFI